MGRSSNPEGIAIIQPSGCLAKRATLGKRSSKSPTLKELYLMKVDQKNVD